VLILVRPIGILVTAFWIIEKVIDANIIVATLRRRFGDLKKLI
jgi:hypothetical protein